MRLRRQHEVAERSWASETVRPVFVSWPLEQCVYLIYASQPRVVPSGNRMVVRIEHVAFGLWH